MIEVIGVRFRENGKIYSFNPLDIQVEPGDFVIVETARGMEYGKVVRGRYSFDEKSLQTPIKPIIRKATDGIRRRARKHLISVCRRSRSISWQ